MGASARQHQIVQNPHFEVGYGSDTNLADKESDKAKQHEQLVQMLVAAGCDVKYRYHPPITLGRCGAIPLSLYNMFRNDFRMASKRADEYAGKLSAHAAQWVEK